MPGWLEKKVERDIIPKEICDEKLERYKVLAYYQMPESCIPIIQTANGLYTKVGEFYKKLENLMEK